VYSIHGWVPPHVTVRSFTFPVVVLHTHACSVLLFDTITDVMYSDSYCVHTWLLGQAANITTILLILLASILLAVPYITLAIMTLVLLIDCVMDPAAWFYPANMACQTIHAWLMALLL